MSEFPTVSILIPLLIGEELVIAWIVRVIFVVEEILQIPEGDRRLYMIARFEISRIR